MSYDPFEIDSEITGFVMEENLTGFGSRGPEPIYATGAGSFMGAMTADIENQPNVPISNVGTYSGAETPKAEQPERTGRVAGDNSLAPIQVERDAITSLARPGPIESAEPETSDTVTVPRGGSTAPLVRPIKLSEPTPAPARREDNRTTEQITRIVERTVEKQIPTNQGQSDVLKRLDSLENNLNSSLDDIDRYTRGVNRYSSNDLNPPAASESRIDAVSGLNRVNTAPVVAGTVSSPEETQRRATFSPTVPTGSAFNIPIAEPTPTPTPTETSTEQFGTTESDFVPGDFTPSGEIPSSPLAQTTRQQPASNFSPPVQQSASNFSPPPVQQPAATSDFSEPSFEDDVRVLQERGFPEEIAKQMVSVQREEAKSSRPQNIQQVREEVSKQIDTYQETIPESERQEMADEDKLQTSFNQFFDKKVPELQEMIKKTSRENALDIIHDVWEK